MSSIIKFHSKKVVIDISLIAILVFIINFFTMPRIFYAGDSSAIKVNAINLVNTGKFGINPLYRDKIKGSLKLKGQYFHKNKDGDYYSRWGFFNTIVSSIPEFFVSNQEKSNLTVSVDGIWAHNLLNVLLSCVFAVLLFLICGYYTNARASKYFYVISVIYGTYVWNYLRAQSYEIIHLVSFALFYYSYLKYIELKKTRWSLISNLALMFFAFSKFFYILLFPIVFFYNRYALKNTKNRDMQFVTALIFVFTLLVLLVTNYIHFDSFVFTKNASHDPYNAQVIPFSFSYFSSRIFDYFISAKSNVFFYFPPILLLALNFKKFYSLNKNTYLMIVIVSIFYFLVLSTFYTFGEWCYGPRFFVFILPFLTLPLLSFYEELLASNKVIKRFLLPSILIILFAYSSFLQINMNKKDFFLYYRLQGTFSVFKDKEVDDYFKKIPTPVIIRDFDNFMNGKENFLLLERVASNVKIEDRSVLLGRLLYRLKSLNQCNFFYSFMCSYL